MILIDPPEVTPVSLEEMQEYLRIELSIASPSETDELLQSYIESAVQWVESYCRRALITQSWQMMLEHFPHRGSFISLPRPPLQTVESVKYLCAGDVAYAEWDDDEYGVDLHRSRIYPKFGYIWPIAVFDPSNGVTVDYTCGYGDAADDVPQAIRTALKFLVANWYENREPVVVGLVSSKVTFTLESLLAPYRWAVLP